VVLEFFPAMALITLHLFRAASLFVAEYLSLGPERALYWSIVVLLRASSEILRVVCIDTLISIMLINVWTKNCLEFIEVEVFIFLEIMKEFDFDFLFVVSKRAKVAILAFVNIVRV
jgi:hypothetical protein